MTQTVATTMRPRWALAVLAAFMIVAGCSLPTESRPRAIEHDEFSELLESESTTKNSPGDGGSYETELYFVTEGGLVSVERNLKSNSPRALIQAIADGPTEDEQNEGISGSVPPNTVLIHSEHKKDLLIIDVTEDLLDVKSPNDKTAYGQIVYTLVNADPRVTRVQIRVDGEPTKIPTDDGAKDDASKDDFRKTAKRDPLSE